MRPTSATYRYADHGEPTLQEILVALSFALDLTEGAVPGHAIRSCLLAVRIALTVGLDLTTISDLYYATLLKDVGCSSNSARMCQITGGDDRAIKAGAKLADWTRPLRPQLSTIKLLWDQVLPGANVLDRGRRIVQLAATQHVNNRELIELRCDRGASIIRKLGLGDQIAIAVRHLDEHWDGGGYPLGRADTGVPLLSRLMGVAQHLDAFCMQSGPEVAIDVLVERSGRWFDPDLTNAVLHMHQAGTLWRQCLPKDPVEETRSAILDLYPNEPTTLSAFDIDAICEAFSDVVDAKSPFTYRHSIGVMNAAVAIGNVLGLPSHRMQILRRSALLHDVGKLGISNTILDKPGRLTDEEFTTIKRHPGIGAEILRRVAAFDEIAILATEHHERLDGNGYPNRLSAADLSVESRILAVADIYGALSEHRPYRSALPASKIISIMDHDVGTRIDRDAYAALRVVMDNPDWVVTPAPSTSITYDPAGEFVEVYI